MSRKYSRRKASPAIPSHLTYHKVSKSNMWAKPKGKNGKCVDVTQQYLDKFVAKAVTL